MINRYGPTECTIDVTTYKVVPTDKVVPIGAPLPNCVCYVLGEQLQPLPVGGKGELYLGGVQVRCRGRRHKT